MVECGRLCRNCGIPIDEKVLNGSCLHCMLGIAFQPYTDSRESLVPSIEDLRPHFPQLEILHLLGSGGMGAVFKASQPRLNRFVALKVLCCPPEQEEAFSVRFETEAQLLAGFSHPNIVSLYEFGEIDKGPEEAPLFYFLMEYVEGSDLEDKFRNKEVSVTESLAIMAKVCDALSYAHEKGVVHRDIKPANLLLSSSEIVKVSDFGIARILSRDETGGIGLTLTGSTLGTPFYMAPEILDGHGKADHRSDIYSVGVVLHQLLTGERPSGLLELPSKRNRLPRFLDRLISPALARDPGQRISTAAAFAAKTRKALKRYQRTKKLRKFVPQLLRMIAVAGVMGATLFLLKNWSDTLTHATTSLESTSVASPSFESAAPGSLVAMGTFSSGEEIDLSPAEPFSDFTEVFLGTGEWIALRSNGETISLSGEADRRNISRICRGINDHLTLISRAGFPEIFSEFEGPSPLNTMIPEAASKSRVRELLADKHRATALLEDGSVIVWGEAYDSHETIPQWIRIRGEWKRHPKEALQNVVSIGMGLSWDGTVTGDGRIWIWGKNGLLSEDCLPDYQGNFSRLFALESDQIEAQLKDGRIVRFRHFHTTPQIFDAPVPEDAVFHSGTQRIFRTSDGS